MSLPFALKMLILHVTEVIITATVIYVTNTVFLATSTERKCFMSLLEKGYRAAAKTELERDIRKLEARDKAAQTRTDFTENTNGILSNIAFAQRINLISEQQAQEMRRRVNTAVAHNRFMRNESEERVDDFENPRERSERYFKMDSVQAEISRKRSATEREQVNDQNHDVRNRHTNNQEK